MLSAEMLSKRSAPRPAQSPTLSPDEIGDDRRVSRIVFGDARFDLADEIGADVGLFGEDAAAEAATFERFEGR